MYSYAEFLTHLILTYLTTHRVSAGHGRAALKYSTVKYLYEV